MDTEELRKELLKKLMAHEAIDEITSIFDSVISSLNTISPNSKEKLENKAFGVKPTFFKFYKQPSNKNYSSEEIMKTWQLDSETKIIDASREQILNTLNRVDEALEYTRQVTSALVAINKKLKNNELVQSEEFRHSIENKETKTLEVSSKPNFKP